jgi:hypothetical protein
VTAHASRQFEDGMMVRADDQAAADGALGERRSLVGAKPLERGHAIASAMEKDRGLAELDAAAAAVPDVVKGADALQRSSPACGGRPCRRLIGAAVPEERGGRLRVPTWLLMH